jgi:Uma2 family endonuclease
MRPAQIAEIDYPESDGRPMGETDLHRWWMVQIHQLLEHRYRGQEVYIGCDLLLFYVEGDPKKFVVPDNFVVLDCKPEFRRSFRIWTESRVPNVVFEVTSRKTKKQDEVLKPEVYARIGVRELFLYDPTLDYLATALQGYRLEGGRYERLERNTSGALESSELNLLLRLDRERLVIQDATTGMPLLTKAEAEEARAEAEQAHAKAERERAERAEKRASALELELERLRQQIRERGQ